jgi:hypothetical protein
LQEIRLTNNRISENFLLIFTMIAKNIQNQVPKIIFLIKNALNNS